MLLCPPMATEQARNGVEAAIEFALVQHLHQRG